MDTPPTRSNFIRDIIEDDLREQRHQQIVTRFPPEPNGYLHIGHAKSICLNFGVARDHAGRCNLRFDDTNPGKESAEFEQAIAEDVQWLGFTWEDRYFHASDYFEQLYAYAVQLIEHDQAYVDSQSAGEIRLTRGTLTEPGSNSPYRNRTAAANLDLFARMRRGEFSDGAHVLRAKIDMASPNINLRDPTLYRIRQIEHHRTGGQWHIYPLYDYSHCISDALEGITHSLCTLEFEDHRPLYDWVLAHLSVPCRPRQIEFARLEINYTITSKRKLHALVSEGLVAGWDDPRLPTLQGMRRRGYPAAAIREFCERVGITKKQTVIDMGVLETCVREELDRSAPRVMAVLDPVKLVLENYPVDLIEQLPAANHPKDPAFGERLVDFSREIYLERDDFMEIPSKGFFRLSPGREVRLRWAYLVTCTDVIKDPQGEIIEIRARYDPATRGGNAPDNRAVKGTLHWVSAATAISAEVRLYDRLFTRAEPSGEDFRQQLNPASERRVPAAQLEAALGTAAPGAPFQFERLGYFCADRHDHTPARPVFNRTVTLRDTWAKVQGRRD